MNYEEYCERVGKNAESRTQYDFYIEPFYMALEMNKDAFCEFIQTDGAKQAMKAYCEKANKCKVICAQKVVLREHIEHLECMLTREQDEKEYEEAMRVHDLLGHTMVDDELRRILQDKMDYYQDRLSK